MNPAGGRWVVVAEPVAGPAAPIVLGPFGLEASAERKRGKLAEELARRGAGARFTVLVRPVVHGATPATVLADRLVRPGRNHPTDTE